jgi:hypothetical protein
MGEVGGGGREVGQASARLVGRQSSSIAERIRDFPIRQWEPLEFRLQAVGRLLMSARPGTPAD